MRCLDGKLQHQFLVSISRSFLGLLEDKVHAAYHIDFEHWPRLLLNKSKPQYDEYIRLNHYYVIGDMQDLEKLLDTPYM